MQGAKKTVIIIYTRPRRIEVYPSISKAAKATGISRQRIIRGLQDDEGLIPSTRPAVYVDEGMPVPDDDSHPL